MRFCGFHRDCSGILWEYLFCLVILYFVSSNTSVNQRCTSLPRGGREFNPDAARSTTTKSGAKGKSHTDKWYRISVLLGVACPASFMPAKIRQAGTDKVKLAVASRIQVPARSEPFTHNIDTEVNENRSGKCEMESGRKSGSNRRALSKEASALS